MIQMCYCCKNCRMDLVGDSRTYRISCTKGQGLGLVCVAGAPVLPWNCPEFEPTMSADEFQERLEQIPTTEAAVEELEREIAEPVAGPDDRPKTSDIGAITAARDLMAEARSVGLCIEQTGWREWRIFAPNAGRRKDLQTYYNQAAVFAYLDAWKDAHSVDVISESAGETLLLWGKSADGSA